MKAIEVITILALLLGDARPLQCGERTEKRTEFGSAREVGFALTRYHDTCIMFRAYFVSGEFFAGLRRNKPPDDSRFKKGHRTFDTFPDQLFVDVEATAFSCSGGRIPPDFGEGLLSDPAFEIAWKMAGEMHPTKVFPNPTRHKNYSLRWDYFLQISAKDIALTQELIVQIVLRSGTERCQISARLE
jgi:hypothetical protein